MARADVLDARISEQRLHAPREVADRARGRLLDEEVARMCVLEGEEHEIDGFVEAHEEARHVGIRDRDGLSRFDLFDEERDDAAARAHDVAVARAADGRLRFVDRPGFREHDFFHHGLRDAHRVDGVRRLVRRKADNFPHARADGRREHVVRAEHVRPHGLDGEKFARRHLLQRRCMEDVVDAVHRVLDAPQVAHVADIVLDLVALVMAAHVVLLLFVTGKNANLADVRREKPAEHGIAERARASRDEERLA